MRLPGIRRYVQSDVLVESYAKGPPIYDGIAEVWADDTDALRAMTASAARRFTSIPPDARARDRGLRVFEATRPSRRTA